LNTSSDQEVSQEIVSLLENNPKYGLTIRQLIKKMGLTLDQRRRIRRLLKLLQNEGKVVWQGRNHYRLAKESEYLEGTFVVNGNRGACIESVGTDDKVYLRVNSGNWGGALPGDRVRVLVIRKRDKWFWDVTVVEILARGGLPIVGVLTRSDGKIYVEPDDPRIDCLIRVDADEAKQIEEQHLVIVKIDDPTPRSRPKGKIIKVLGEPGKLDVELDRLIYQNGLEEEFSQQAESEASTSTIDIEADIESRRRRDLRGLAHITIDPPDAKDFDDAVYAKKDGQGYILLVSIADVASYVPLGGAIDEYALERGCSVYLPSKVIPMLPFGLSSKLCTLSVGQDKAAMTVEMKVDSAGKVVDSKVYRSVIRSVARKTYQQAQEIIDRHESRDATGAEFECLDALVGCARLLMMRMKQRGMLDLDLPESDIQLDEEGKPIEVRQAERLFSNRLIEVCMISANEEIAQIMNTAEIPTIYRVHQEPDQEKMESFSLLAKLMGAPAGFGATPSPKQLLDYIDSIDDSSLCQLLSMMLLRSLMQAKYSENCQRHFGLASDCYLHFTSPIRRYPDLIVHHQLGFLLDQAGREGIRKSSLGKKEYTWPLDLKKIGKIADKSSMLERRAIKVERDATDLYHAYFIREHVGNQYSGIISMVTDFGVFVRLKDFFVEGMIHISRFKGDHYRYYDSKLALVGRRRGKVFTIGMDVEVVVESVDLSQRRIDFSLVED
jgi:ribonuclease R